MVVPVEYLVQPLLGNHIEHHNTEYNQKTRNIPVLGTLVTIYMQYLVVIGLVQEYNMT